MAHVSSYLPMGDDIHLSEFLGRLNKMRKILDLGYPWHISHNQFPTSPSSLLPSLLPSPGLMSPQDRMQRDWSSADRGWADVEGKCGHHLHQASWVMCLVGTAGFVSPSLSHLLPGPDSPVTKQRQRHSKDKKG